MRENLPSALLNLFEWEGLRSNDPADPGGETVCGISRHYYPHAFKDWRNPTLQERDTFYLAKWIEAGCDALPFPLDCLHFDASINPGPGAAKEFLRQTAEHADPLRRCVEYATLRIRYYLKKVRENPVKLKFLGGWTDRTLDFLERTVLAMWDMEEIQK